MTDTGLRRLRTTWGRLVAEIAKFGIVGLINFFIDVGIFNLLRVDVAPHKPVTAKAISTAIAATSSYFMNRHWTWRDRARTGLAREYVLFIILSVVGLGITEACLAVSHYGLGFDSVVADNISANGVGLVLGMLWRFWSFKRWVFLEPESGVAAVEDTLRTSV